EDVAPASAPFAPPGQATARRALRKRGGMSARPDWHVFPSPGALAEALAGAVAAALAGAIARRGQALLAVSGGTTPQRFFHALSRQALEWPKVTVTLVDERFVPEGTPRSNATLVRNHLLTN